MNRKIMIALLAVCCLTWGIMLVAQEGRDVSSKIQQLEQEFNQAQSKNDSAWLEQHLADGYVEGESWRAWVTKAEAIKEIQNSKFNKAEISDVKVATFGPDTAVAHYKSTYDATLNGTHRARTVICSDTWINQSGEWKIASDHCSHVEGK